MCFISFQILDEEAEVFVVKMWRLLVYETEAKKLGLVKWCLIETPASTILSLMSQSPIKTLLMI